MHKFLIIFISIIFISMFVNTVMVIPFVLAVSLVSYVCIDFISKIESDKSRMILYNLFWFLYVSIFIFLEYSGIVGTLNGDKSSLISQLVITIGLPFYFLQIIGVCYDVAKKNIIMPTLLDFIFYIVYFPKFISGPIEKASFLEKIKTFKLHLNSNRLNVGISWIIIGLFFKYVLANHIQAFVHLNEATSPTIIFFSSLFFELRVYFDLAGYSFMAFGLSHILGLDLTLNFHHPFFQRNIREFWQNWHISLGRWFHYYVFTPLKEYKKIKFGMILPFIVFISSAMWHGATFNFLLWGLFHATMYVLYIKVLHKYNYHRLIGFFSLMLVLIFGRLLFMDADSDRLILKLTTLFSIDSWLNDIENMKIIIKTIIGFDGTYMKVKYFAIVAIITVLFTEYKNKENQKSAYSYFHNRYVIACMFTLILLCGISNETVGFIYGRQ